MSDDEDIPDLVEDAEAVSPNVKVDVHEPPVLAQNMPQEQTDFSPKVPITIVTGFLGSGKSTLLNHILTSNHGKRIAVILNEFGDSSDIERSLSVSSESELCEEWLDLKNGCMCCTLKDNAVTAIENLMLHKGKFDYILLETTGLADPAPIVNMFWLDEGLSGSIYLDGVVTLVDAPNLARSLNETARLQISHADVLLLNKMDRIGLDVCRTVRETVRDINALASIAETTFSKVNLDLILDLHAYDARSVDVTHANSSSHHDADISTMTIPVPALRPDRIDYFEKSIQRLLWTSHEEGIEILRMKGRICDQEGRSWILQGVRDIYEMVEYKASAEEQGKLVFIGKGLKHLPILLCSTMLD